MSFSKDLKKFPNSTSFSLNDLINNIYSELPLQPTFIYEKVGDKKREWKNVLEAIDQKPMKKIKPRKVDGEAMGELSYVKNNLDVEKLKNPYILNPKEYKTPKELFDAIEHWWVFKKRKNITTVKKRIAIAKRLSEHPVLPIDWKKLDPIQAIAYLEEREYIEGAGKCAIRNEWDTIKMFAKAYGKTTETWGYTPPSRPPAKVKIIPLPNTTYDIVHNKYSKDKYVNSLYQYILMHGFLIGWRPSELVIQKVSDIYIDDGYLIISETKKHGQLRQIFPEKTLMEKKQCKSMKNWIDSWRPKVENQYSGDYLYLQSNGKPFSASYLRKILPPLVKQVWKPFCLYTMRHWCATARLIKSKVDTKWWDIWEVKEWLGHDKIRTTENYVKYAKKYYRNAPYDWIKSILKFHKKMEGENGQNSINSDNGDVLTKINRSIKERTRRDSNPRSLA